MSLYAQRLIRLYNRLRRGPVTIDVVTKWAKQAGIEITDRQLYRDLNTLSKLKFAEGENIEEYTDEKNKKTWKLEYESSSDLFTQFDLNSFYLFKNFTPISIQQYRKSSLEKLEEIFYKSLSKNKIRMTAEAGELYLNTTNLWHIQYGKKEHELIDELLWALQNKRKVTVLADEINTTNIDLEKYPLPLKLLPMEMIFHSGRVYISGLGDETGKLLIYNVTDGLTIEPTNEAFNRKKYQQSYDDQLSIRYFLGEPIDGKVYHIKLEFGRDYGLSMKKVFIHKTAVWKELPNGNLMLEMHCGISRELIGFLGHSLDQMKVHAPGELRDLIVKKLRSSLGLYDGKEINEKKSNEDY